MIADNHKLVEEVIKDNICLYCPDGHVHIITSVERPEYRALKNRYKLLIVRCITCGGRGHSITCFKESTIMEGDEIKWPIR